jgi:hypothetical protein
VLQRFVGHGTSNDFELADFIDVHYLTGLRFGAMLRGSTGFNSSSLDFFFFLKEKVKHKRLISQAQQREKKKKKKGHRASHQGGWVVEPPRGEREWFNYPHWPFFIFLFER